MKKNTIIYIVIAGIVMLLCGVGCSKYNGMATAEQGVKRAWSDVETAYQMRADKVPNLVEIVEGAAAHERNTLQAVTEARAQLSSININAEDFDAEQFKQYEAAQNQLTAAMKSLFAVSEAYPDLKANESYLKLMDEYNGIENRIRTSRMDYNKVAESFNRQIVTFPGNLFASIFGFKESPYFSAAAGAENAPKINMPK
ncbi:MAG: LemA family protein [Bacteroidales bacterium]|nr:LemA family protein [Bacteroidales bacterium]